MKQILIIIALMLTISVSAQKMQLRPITAFDSTAYGSGWKFDWNGSFQVVTQDSINSDGSWNHKYISLNTSYVQLIMTKKRGVGVGDTIQRQETIQIPFANIPTIVSSVYSSTTFKNAYKTKIRALLTRKISEE